MYQRISGNRLGRRSPILTTLFQIRLLLENRLKILGNAGQDHCGYIDLIFTDGLHTAISAWKEIKVDRRRRLNLAKMRLQPDTRV